MTSIPSFVSEPDDKERRFYIGAPSSVYLSLQEQAFKRGTTVYALAGAVLSEWIRAGAPVFLCPSPHPEPEREAVLSGSHLPRFSHVGGVSAGETGGSTDSTARVIVTRQGQDKTASRFGLGRLRLEHVPIGRAQGVNGLRSVQQILLQLGFMEPKV